jgi:DNA-binding transcriptional MerR regulator
MGFSRNEIRNILGDSHTEEIENRLIALHLSVVDPMKDDILKYKKDSEKLAEVQKKLDTLTAQVEADAEKRKGKDYDALKAEFEKYKADAERKEHKAEVEAKFRELLKDMNVSDNGIAKILKWRGVDDVNLDDDGKISNSKELRKSIKEDWPEYITTDTVKGVNTSTPPANNGGGKMTIEQIDAITDTAERQKAMLENHELYGF